VGQPSPSVALLWEIWLVSAQFGINIKEEALGEVQHLKVGSEGAGGVARAMVYLPGKRKAPSSNPRMHKNRNRAETKTKRMLSASICGSVQDWGRLFIQKF
jgi:hypothetical protein